MLTIKLGRLGWYQQLWKLILGELRLLDPEFDECGKPRE